MNTLKIIFLLAFLAIIANSFFSAKKSAEKINKDYNSRVEQALKDSGV